MVVEGIQAVPTVLNHVSHWHDTWGMLNHLLSIDWHGLAQLKTDTDLFGNVSNAWNNFVKTGQIWALLIGLALGYLVKSFL